MHATKFDCLNPHSEWLCLRSNNLVYVVTLKCASSMYRSIFTRLGWEYTTLKSINWEQDKVFSYIREPHKRRIAAVAEYASLQSPYAGTAIVCDEKYMKMMNDIFILDHHTISIRDMLGTNAELVDWIPMDTDVDHIKMTELFLKHNGNSVDLRFAYHMSSAERNVTIAGPRKIVQDYLATLPQHTYVQSYLDYDDVLYRHVTMLFNPTGGSWHDISWLKTQS